MRIISGTAKGRKLLSPEGMVTRPTLDRIKESIFNIIQHRAYGSVVLDMFSGTGSLGIEAASRGAEKCYLIDRDDITFSYLKQNVENLRFQDICECHKGDTYEITRRLGESGIRFDLVFIDPPYARELIPPALDIIGKDRLLKEDGLIVCKIDSSEQIFEGNDTITLIDKRKYGNTTVLFYEYGED